MVAWAPVADATELAVATAAEVLGRHPGPVHHHCPFCGSVEHGRPSFDAPVHLSVAHAPGLSVVAVSTAGPVGVDVEKAGTADAGWVRDEAVGKAYGVGLTGETGPAQVIDLALPGHLAAVAVRAGAMPEVRLAAPAAPPSPASP